MEPWTWLRLEAWNLLIDIARKIETEKRGEEIMLEAVAKELEHKA